MFISDGARFKLPEEIPVEDADYEAVFSPVKITPRRSMDLQPERWVVCHKISSKFQYSRELKEALWQYLRKSNVWMRCSKLGVGSTTAVGWLKNFHPVLQNRDHLADRLSRLVLQFGNLTNEEKANLPMDDNGNHLPVVELVPSMVGETLNGKEYKCAAVQVRAATEMKDRVLENLTTLANSEEGYLPESATFIPFTWSATDKKLHVCAIKEHAKILEKIACISVGGLSQAMLDSEILQADGSTKYVHSLFSEKGLQYEVTTASASKGIFRFLTKKDKLIEAAKTVDAILEIITNDETLPGGIMADFSRPIRFKTSLTDQPTQSAAMLSYTQKMRAELMSQAADSKEETDEDEQEEGQGWHQVQRRSLTNPRRNGSSQLSYASVAQSTHKMQPTATSQPGKSDSAAIKQLRSDIQNEMRLFREEIRTAVLPQTSAPNIQDDRNTRSTNAMSSLTASFPELNTLLQAVTETMKQMQATMQDMRQENITRDEVAAKTNEQMQVLTEQVKPLAKINEQVQAMWTTWEKNDETSARSTKKQKPGTPRRKNVEQEPPETEQVLEEEDDDNGNGDGDCNSSEMLMEAK